MTDYRAWRTFTLPHTDFTEAYQWCDEQFDHGVELDYYYDEAFMRIKLVRFCPTNLPPAWWQRWGYNETGSYFLFRDERDAVAFKLRWSDCFK